jgi:myosin heavy subunit
LVKLIRLGLKEFPEGEEILQYLEEIKIYCQGKMEKNKQEIIDGYDERLELLEKNKTLEIKIEALHTEYEVILARYKEDYEYLVEGNDELKEVFSSLKKKYNQLEGNYSQLLEELEKKEQENTFLQEKLEETVKKEEAQEDTFEKELRKKDKEYVCALEENNKRMEELEEQQKILQKELQKSEEEKRGYEELYLALQEDNNALKAEKVEREKFLESIKAAYDEQINLLKKEIESLKNQIFFENEEQNSDEAEVVLKKRYPISTMEKKKRRFSLDMTDGSGGVQIPFSGSKEEFPYENGSIKPCEVFDIEKLEIIEPESDSKKSSRKVFQEDHKVEEEVREKKILTFDIKTVDEKVFVENKKGIKFFCIYWTVIFLKLSVLGLAFYGARALLVDYGNLLFKFPIVSFFPYFGSDVLHKE